jgi:MFS family permease
MPGHAARPNRNSAGRGSDSPARPAVLAIVAEGFASRLGLGIVSLALPLYALQLGMSLAAIGLLVSSNVLVQLVAKPVLGTVVDRIGLRRSLLIAITIRSTVPLALAFAHAPWQLFAIRAAYGLGQAMRDPALNAVIADLGGTNRVARTFAWYHTAKNVAASIGRAVAGVLLAMTGSNYPLVFAASALISILPVVTVALAVRPAPRPASAPPSHRPLRFGQIAPFTGLAFLFGLTAGMMNLFPVIASRYFGLGPAQIGGIMLATTVVVIVGGPVSGWLSDTVSRRLVLAVRAVANALSSILYLVLPGLLGIGIAKSVDDFGKAAFRPAWGSMMAEIAARDPARRARTMALIELGEDSGDAVAPIVAGALLTAGGLPLMLGVRVVLAVLTEISARTATGSRRLRPGDRPRRIEGWPAVPEPAGSLSGAGGHLDQSPLSPRMDDDRENQSRHWSPTTRLTRGILSMNRTGTADRHES